MAHDATMRKRVLIVVHQAHSTPGRVGELLEARGAELVRCCPNQGDALPQSLDGFAAAVVFGGPMSANDDHLPGIRAELDWLPTAFESGRPLLGICLGAQLMARALGARVAPHPDGLVEIGWHEVRPTAAGRPHFQAPTTFYQWHRETFDLPAGSVHLAENDAFASQAFHYGNAFGIEFHPEMTSAMIDRWTTSEGGAPQLVLPGSQPRDVQLKAYARYAPSSDAWLGRFLDRHLLASDDLGQAPTSREPRVE